MVVYKKKGMFQCHLVFISNKIQMFLIFSWNVMNANLNSTFYPFYQKTGSLLNFELLTAIQQEWSTLWSKKNLFKNPILEPEHL